MTSSTNLDLDLVAHAGDVDTWDTPTNSNWSIVDANIGGSTALNATGLTGNQTLAAASYQKGQLIVSGVPTGTVTYVVPSGVGGRWVFENNATGSFSTVGIKSDAGGSTITLATGARTIVICDGSSTGMKIALASNAVAGGATTQIQVNVAGVIGAYAALTFDGTTLLTTALRTTGTATFGDASADSVVFNAATLTVNSNTSMGGLYVEASGGSNRVAVGQTSFGSAGAQFICSGLIQSVSGGIVFPDGSIQATAAGAGGAAGSTNQIQYNIGGFFSAQSNFTFVPGTGRLSVPLITASGNVGASTFTGAWQGTAISPTYGGTGLTGTPSNGQLPIGTGTGYALATLTAGSGISITNASGGITITALSSGGSVTSVDASGGTTGLTFGGGPITGAGTLTAGGVLVGANGGTGVANSGKTITLGGNLATSGAFALTFTLTSSTSLILPTAGTLLTTTGSGAGLSNLSATAITSGTLGAANGGTGLATLTANNVILGNGTSAVQLVAPGTSGNVLTSNGTTWASTTNRVNTGTVGHVPFYSSSSVLGDTSYILASSLSPTLTVASDGITRGTLTLNAISGGFATSIVPTNGVSPVITLPSTTDTLVGKNTTDVLAGKTLNVAKVTAYTVATLPAATVSMLAYVTDADMGLVWGDTVINSGGGATKYLAWYNGSVWSVLGK